MSVDKAINGQLQYLLNIGWDECFLHPPFNLTQALINPYADCLNIPHIIQLMIELSPREKHRDSWLKNLKLVLDHILMSPHSKEIGSNYRFSYRHQILLSYKSAIHNGVIYVVGHPNNFRILIDESSDNPLKSTDIIIAPLRTTSFSNVYQM